ncbi:uncharacterized protein PGTG_20099 [Puccinia graminis f. sp. tritici CRL 75-36-700-3]|uniref:Uncharacterized protein n=1 Tax=Puccinia graminis f. sp. tritici (strain CRL 75-36-700-3 / race SCCL) TaxID=418459 RepID=E3NXA0_PUCGT|nr:uncharacterized protein PGTG_20099 [Puccinia graminis f. sp. tritici CRL 75-36-700-3]EFP94199.1 hypothetical protein PGTG_20099 [Puccinia graminis f. sp. tritici CRL 75-36-700-3]
MFYTIIGITLLFLNPCQTLFLNEGKDITHTGDSTKSFGYKAGLFSINPKSISKVPKLGKKEAEGIFQDYTQAEKSFFFIGADGTIKPHDGDNSVKHKQRVIKVLTELSANLNNQVWLVTSKEVSELETTYGKIPGLNLADISNTKQLLKAKLLEISSNLNVAGRMNDEEFYRLPYIHYYEDDNKEKINMEMNQMREALQEAIKNNQIFEDFEVEFIDQGDKFELSLQHKVYSNMGLIPAMVLQKGAHDFALSVGDMDMEEKMHKVLRTAGCHAIIVKEEESIVGKFAKCFQYPEEFDFKSGSMWKSYASYRLDNHEKAIRFLESLIESSPWEILKESLAFWFEKLMAEQQGGNKHGYDTAIQIGNKEGFN